MVLALKAINISDPLKIARISAMLMAYNKELARNI